MKVTAFYNLPLDDKLARDMVDKAREVGHPVLAVILEVEDKPNRSVGGFALGALVAELDTGMAALGGGAHFAESFESLDLITERTQAREPWNEATGEGVDLA